MRKFLLCAVLLTITFFAGSTIAQQDTNCRIKGFVGSSGKKLYLLPGHYLYEKIHIDPEKGERWFCSENEAKKAGFLFVPDPNNPQLGLAQPTPTPQPEPTATPTPQAPEEIMETPTPAVEEVSSTDEALPESESGEQPESPAPPEETSPAAESPESEDTTQPEETTTEEETSSDTGTFETPTGFEMPPIELPGGIPVDPAAFKRIFMIAMIVAVILSIFFIIVMWIVYKKAGQPGWGVLIPIYNVILMLRIAGMPGWLVILIIFIPFVNLILAFVMTIKIAQNFGKGILYGLGLFFLPFLFYPHLAFSSAEYTG